MSDSFAIVDVVLDSGHSCDICCGDRDGDHWGWECPSCGQWHDEPQEMTPATFKCRCGVTMRVTEEAHERWASYEYLSSMEPTA